MSKELLLSTNENEGWGDPIWSEINYSIYDPNNIGPISPLIRSSLVVYKNKILIYGSAYSPYNHFYQYSPDDNILEIKSVTIPYFISGNTGCVIDDYVYFVRAKQIYRHQPETDEWIIKTSYDFGTTKTSVVDQNVFSYNNKIYIAGGKGSSGNGSGYSQESISKIFEYDPSVNSMISYNHSFLSSSLVCGDGLGNFYLYGGYSESGSGKNVTTNRYKSLKTFNTVTKDITTVTLNLGPAVANGAIFYRNNKLYQYGGEGIVSGQENSITKIDLANNKTEIYTPEGIIPIMKYYLGYCTLNNKMYLFSGLPSSLKLYCLK